VEDKNADAWLDVAKTLCMNQITLLENKIPISELSKIIEMRKKAQLKQPYDIAVLENVIEKNLTKLEATEYRAWSMLIIIIQRVKNSDNKMDFFV